MRPIPKKLKAELLADPYYKRCCLTGFTRFKIDFHHAWDYGGKQINEAWAIMPVWVRKHSPQGDKDSVHNCKATKEYVQYLSLKRATPKDLKKYPKKNWQQVFNYLDKKYGKA